MSKKSELSYDELLDLYQSLIEKQEGIELKGAKSKYTSLNGNMFSFLTPDRELCFRLGKDERAAFLDKFEDSICIQYGAVMKDYVVVPASIVGNRRQLSALFSECVANAKTLKPKPTTRKKK